MKYVHGTLQIMIFLTPLVTYDKKAPNSVTRLVDKGPMGLKVRAINKYQI